MKSKVAIGFFILFFALSGDILLPGEDSQASTPSGFRVSNFIE